MAERRGAGGCAQADCHPPVLSPARRNRVLSRWRVFAGAVAQASPHGLQLGMQAVVYHGAYLPFRDPSSEENSNDIALVRLSSSLPLTGESASWPGDPRGWEDGGGHRGLRRRGEKEDGLAGRELGSRFGKPSDGSSTR